MKLNIKNRFKKRAEEPESEVGELSEKKAAKRRAFKAAKGARFVLLIGDEGAILVRIKDNEVLSRQFVPDSSTQSLKELTDTLAEDPKAPILMVVDSMDQSHVQQTLPPVSSLSVNKLIKRRLERDFGVDAIKGAVPLGREKEGRKDWNFMMVALDNSPHIRSWIEFVESLPNRLTGIHFVSVEAETLVKCIERAMGVSKETAADKWKFFVSHNKVGGFRQVILKNGRIAFTRLAQPVGEFNPEVIAGNIEQEMMSTIEYMKRLSFNPSEGFDIYIIASAGVKPLIDPKKFGATTMHIFTPYEISEFLNIQGATQPTDQFGDVILATVIGCTKKHVLTLITELARKYNSLHQMMMMQRAFVALVGVALLGYAGYVGFELFENESKLGDLEQSRVVQQQGLETLKQEIAQSKYDVDKADEVIDLYKQLEVESLSPQAFLTKLHDITKLPVLFRNIQWSVDKTAAPPPAPEGAPPGTGQKQTAELVMEFLQPISEQKEFKAFSDKVLEEFRRTYPGSEINYTVLPAQFVERTNVEIDFAATQANKQNGDRIETTLTIKGPFTTVAPAVPAVPAAPVPPPNPGAAP